MLTGVAHNKKKNPKKLRLLDISLYQTLSHSSRKTQISLPLNIPRKDSSFKGGWLGRKKDFTAKKF